MVKKKCLAVNVLSLPTLRNYSETQITDKYFSLSPESCSEWRSPYGGPLRVTALLGLCPELEPHWIRFCNQISNFQTRYRYSKYKFEVWCLLKLQKAIHAHLFRCQIVPYLPKYLSFNIPSLMLTSNLLEKCKISDYFIATHL